jgi:hypothetical protein
MQADCFFTLPRVKKIDLFPHRPTNQTRTTFAGSVTSFVSSHWMRTQIPTGAGHTTCDSVETVPNPRPEKQLSNVNHRHVRKKKVTSSSSSQARKKGHLLASYFHALSPISGCGSRPRFFCETRLSVTNTAPRFRVLWTSHTRRFCVTAHRRPSVYFFSPKVFSPPKKPPNQPSGTGKRGPQKKREFFFKNYFKHQ